MVYVEIDITKELPPNNANKYFIVKYNGEGSWNDDEVGEHTGAALNGEWGRMVKCWLKPVRMDSGEKNTL